MMTVGCRSVLVPFVRFCLSAIVAPVVFATAAACSSPTGTGDQPPLLAILGSAAFSGAGQTSQLRAIETPSNAEPNDATSRATWNSGNTGIATVSATGLVTAVGYGATVVKAAHNGATAQIDVVVSIAGTWTSAARADTPWQMTWTLSQTGSSVTGGGAFVPASPPGYRVASAKVVGTLSGTTLAFRLLVVVTDNSSSQTCGDEGVGLTGTADLGSGTSMIVRPTGSALSCDPDLPASLFGPFTTTAVTLNKQSP